MCDLHVKRQLSLPEDEETGWMTLLGHFFFSASSEKFAKSVRREARELLDTEKKKRRRKKSDAKKAAGQSEKWTH